VRLTERRFRLTHVPVVMPMGEEMKKEGEEEKEKKGKNKLFIF
jgi:hypothetical protein